jgi:hypothetical protein
MDSSFHRPETDTQQSTGFFASLHFLNRTLEWLAGLIKLTDEEQKDAGIYIGDERND